MFDKKSSDNRKTTAMHSPEGNNVPGGMLIHGGDEIQNQDTEENERINEEIDEEEEEFFYRNDKSSLFYKNLQPKKNRFDAPLRH